MADQPMDTLARLMGTMIKSQDALFSVMRGSREDAVIAQHAADTYSSAVPAAVGRAQQAWGSARVLAGGADPVAGQTRSSGGGGGGAPASPVDPGAGQTGAGQEAAAPRAAKVFNALVGQTGGGLLRGPNGRFISASAYSSQGGYVPGYGYYGGGASPYGQGGGQPGGGGGYGGPRLGIPPSGGGGSGSHLGMVGAIASKLPVVGLAAKGVEEVLGQREKNSYYQNVEGGSNAGGFGERLSEEGYRWETLGMFSSAEAREAFKGVTRIGYNGRSTQTNQPSRQDALNFVYHGKSSYGATVDESLMTLQESSKNTNISLTDLSKTLKQLSDDAGKAGTNAQMARSQMVGLMSTGIAAGYGAGSVSAAGSIQDTLASYGKSYADTSGAGQLSAGFSRYAATQAGMTYGQLTALQKTNPAAAASVRTGAALQGAAAALTPAMQSFLHDQIAASGGQVDESVSLRIASAFLTKFGREVDPGVMLGQLSSLTGMQFSDVDHAIGWVVMQMAGKTEAATAAKSAAPSDYAGLGLMTQADAQAKGIWSPATAPQRSAGKGSSVVLSPGQNPNAALALTPGGMVDPVMAALEQKIPDMDQEKVLVHTASGPRVMSLKDAMRNHPNELASGQARFTSGKETGRSVADLLGTQADVSRAWGDEAAKTDNSGTAAPAGLLNSLSAAQSSGAAKVTIDLSADARRLLTVMGTVGPAGAAGQAAPPFNPYAADPSQGR